VGSARISNKGFLPIAIDQYLTILDDSTSLAERYATESEAGFHPLFRRF
jgi:hypothetical protein